MINISVVGEAAAWLPAERGAVQLDIAFESADRSEALREAAELHESLTDAAKAHVESGAATWWGSERVWASTHERYLKDSDIAVPYEVASAALTVKFQDFQALSEWLAEVAAQAGVSVQRVEWTLTEESEQRAKKTIRSRAVDDARERAVAYAEAAGVSNLTLVGIYEPGLHPTAGGFSEGGSPRLASFSMHDSLRKGGPIVELKPSDIEVTASITADFTAG